MNVFKVSEITTDMLSLQVVVDAVVKSSKCGVAANGSPYMDIELGDAKTSLTVDPSSAARSANDPRTFAPQALL